MSVTVNRILIVQTAFIGDVILVLPLIQSAGRLFPQAEIDFLTIPASENIVATIPRITRLWIYDKRENDRGLRGLWDTAAKLRRRQFDLALVPHRSIRSAVLVWLADIPRRIGFTTSAGRLLFTDRIPYPSDGIHEINRNLHLLHPFGFDSSPPVYPELHPTAADREAVDAWLEPRRRADKPLIGMAPGSVWPTKRWPAAYYARLAGRLTADGFQIVWIGGPGDLEIIEKIQNTMPSPALNAGGVFSIRQSAVLIQHCRILVTNDSAPLHLATAIRTPIVAIFGPTVKRFGFFPYDPRDRVAEIDGLFCRPCGIHGGERCPIGTFACMLDLSPEHVYALIKDRLAAGAGPEL